MIKTADVVIIGGGIVGCATAFNLAKRGLKQVVLLEKGYLASGSTGRCAAGIRQQWGTEMNCLLARESIKIFENIREELGGEYDIELNQVGYLIFATTEKEVAQFKKNIRLQQRLGIPSRLLSPEEAKVIVPHINTEMMMAAAFCQTDGYCNPFLATLAYGDAARKSGVEICTYTEVTGIKVEKGKIAGVVTDKGEIATRVVLNAAGGFAGEIGEMAGVLLPFYPERHQALVTEPVEPLQTPMVMSFSYNIYCQQTPHGSFIMGYGDPHEPKSTALNSSWAFLQEIARKVTRVLPKMKDIRVVRQWAGSYDMTPDRQPILGAIPEVEGFHVAIGFSGHGFMHGPMTGVLMAEHLLGQETSMKIDMLGVGRFAQGELLLEPSVV